MTQKGIIVVAKPGESIDSLINRFKWVVFKSGILKDYLQKQYYLKPSELRRKKEFARRCKKKPKSKKKLSYAEILYKELSEKMIEKENDVLG